MANQGKQVELVVHASGTFGVVIEGKLYNAHMNRDAAGNKVEWITRGASKVVNGWTKEAIETAASLLVGLTPRE